MHSDCLPLKQGLNQNIKKNPAENHKIKIFQIKKQLNCLIQKFSEDLDDDLFKELNSFLTLDSSFFGLRSLKHLCRLVITKHLIQKNIRRALMANSEKRAFQLRFLPTHLQSPFGKKLVYGILASLSLDKYEYFDEEHVLIAIQKRIPTAQLIQGSRLLFRDPKERKLCTVYLEVEIGYGKRLSSNERKLFLQLLPQELKSSIQKLVPMLFSVRNEEQIMKSILVLNRELTDEHRLIQMMILFEKQLENALVFNVILVHVHIDPITEAQLYQFSPSIEVSLERREIIGYLKDGSAKKFSLFRFQLSKSLDILRKDFSVDLYRARQKIYDLIYETFGEVRDYDGGLIIKQRELLSQLSVCFPDVVKKEKELIENFFYSIYPIDRQATMPLNLLKIFFDLVLSSLHSSLNSQPFHFSEDVFENKFLVVVIRTEQHSLKKHLQENKTLLSYTVIKSIFFYQESLIAGYILEYESESERSRLLDSVHDLLAAWQREEGSLQVLRLNFVDPPLSLDPRLAGDEVSKTILQMLFEGLMRIGQAGKPECAIADSFTVFDEGKTYVFHLKKCQWSNGDFISAFDFEYAWKKILLPEFKTPFAHFFYPIKNAAAAKDKKISIDKVGIKALNESTLQVDLEYPIPYFLELVASPLFSPINAAIDKKNPYWADADGQSFVCNGPFYLKKNLGYGYVLEKNQLYRNAKDIALNQVTFTKTKPKEALEMFNNNELHWLGRPVFPWHSLFELAKTDKTKEISLYSNTYWCSLNVRAFPLNCLKLRQALSLAIDRKEIVEMLQDGVPAFSPLPLIHAQYPSHGDETADIGLAQFLLEKALKESGLSLKNFPKLTMIFPESDQRYKISQLIQHQWKKNLGIEIAIKSLSWPELFQKIAEGNYEIAGVRWAASINSALYTLHIFKKSNEYLNFPKWENPDFQKLLDAAVFEENTEKRNALFAHAEAILIKETPVIPILYERHRGLKKDSLRVNIKGDFVDLTHSFFEKSLNIKKN